MKTKKLLITLIALVILVGLTAADLPPRPSPVPPPRPSPAPPPCPSPAPPPNLAELSLVIFPNRSQATAGDTVEFTIIVYNPGNTVRGTRLLVLIPGELEVVRASTAKKSTNFNPNSNKVHVTIGVMHPGDTVTITVQTQVSKQAEPEKSYYAAAKVYYNNRFLCTQFFSNWAAVTVVE